MRTHADMLLGQRVMRMHCHRRGSERAIREVRELEERGLASLKVQAAQYVEALLPPSEAAQGQPCAPSAVRQFCETAVKQPSQEHQMQLLSEPSAVRSAMFPPFYPLPCLPPLHLVILMTVETVRQ